MRPEFQWKKVSLAIQSFFHPRFKILAYHGVVGGDPDLYDVDIESFSVQMSFLYENGYNVLPLSHAILRMRKDTVLPKTVVLTFDDGHRSFLELALPVLNRYRFPSTVFIPTGCIGTELKCSDIKYPVMTREELERCREKKIEIGSHSVTHPDLTRLTYDQIKYEIDQSHNDLVGLFGDTELYFAYPFGLLDDRVKEIVMHSRYIGALCFGSILSNWNKTDMYELKREKILATTSFDEYKEIVDTKNDFKRISIGLRKSILSG